MEKPALGHIQRKILALLLKHPEGISEGEMRAALHIPSEKQGQFGRRRRELNYYYKIDRQQVGNKTVYIYRGRLKEPRDTAPIDAKTRALVLHSAHGRCLLRSA